MKLKNVNLGGSDGQQVGKTGGDWDSAPEEAWTLLMRQS